MMPDMDEMAHNLFVGGWSASRDYGLTFDRIINVAVDAPHSFGNHFNLIDGPGNEPEEMNKAILCTIAALKSGERTLVHCVAGRSRSIVIAAAAYSSFAGIPFASVIERFRVKRLCEDHQPHSALIKMVEGFF